jgi:hypothetical protein
MAAEGRRTATATATATSKAWNADHADETGNGTDTATAKGFLNCHGKS